MDLSGTWRATEADEHLRRAFAESDHPDDDWHPVVVPGHWRSNPSFADSDGPLLFRNRFEHRRPTAGERAWITFAGVFYQSDVWLDGDYLGDTEGYFADHTFEVTEPFADRREHVLAVDVACPPEPDPAAKRNLTGTFQHSDSLDPAWNPGGIWRPVTVETTGPIRIRGLGVVTVDVSDDQAHVRCRAVLDAAEPGTVDLVTTIGDRVEHTETTPVAAGDNAIEWTVAIEQPALWWPHALGDQPLYDITVDAVVEGGSSHRRSRRTGLRTVQLRNWILSVNGERLFVKGATQGPARHALAETSATELQADVRLAVESGLDLIRLHAHLTRPEFYAAADEAGLLLWQDLPLIGGYSRGLRARAVAQAARAVDAVGHHPSVVIWCGHDEPVADEGPPEGTASPTDTRRVLGRVVAHQQIPTWSRAVLDRSVKRALDRADGTRPVVAHSGVWPRPPLLDGTDAHLWFGWRYGRPTDLAEFGAAWPRMVRWVGAFGAASVPDTDAFVEPDRWPALDWDELTERHGLRLDLLDQHVDREGATLAEWRSDTQAHQADVVRTQIEHLRRLKYRPTGGFCLQSFADGGPAISTAVLDHERVPKAAFAALVAACRPVIVVADRLEPTVVAGDRLDLAVHAVSDLRRPLLAAQVTAVLTWPGGRRNWSWQGDLPTDSCVEVGRVDAPIPHTTGVLTLELTLRAEEPEAEPMTASNLDVATITA